MPLIDVLLINNKKGDTVKKYNIYITYNDKNTKTLPLLDNFAQEAIDALSEPDVLYIDIETITQNENQKWIREGKSERIYPEK